MAVTSDDDVPEVATAAGVKSAEDTTAASAAPPATASGLPSVAEPTEEEDRTVRQSFDLRLRHGQRKAGLPAPPLRMTSKKPTVQGLGSPVAAAPAVIEEPPPSSQAEEDSIVTETTTGPRLVGGALPAPMAASGAMKIRRSGANRPDDGAATEDEDDEGEPTEVRSVPADDDDEGNTRRAPRPAAGRPADDSVTAEAPPALRFPPPPRPAAGQKAADSDPQTLLRPLDEDAYNADESVTTRGPAVLLYGDDSVTAPKPILRDVPSALERAPTFEEGTEGTTKKVAPPERTNEPKGRLPDMTADEHGEAVAANRTAVMGLNSGRIADLREPNSDSGLRIPPFEPLKETDHASLSALMVSGLEKAKFPPPPPAPIVIPEPTPLHTAPPLAMPATARRKPAPPRYDSGKKPPYGVLVFLVAFLSFAIPVGLFLVLHRQSDPGPERSASEVVPDHVGKGETPPIKKASASTSASAGKSPKRK